MRVLFLPQKKEVEAKKGESLFDVCKRAGILLGESCSGKGICKKCKVIVDWEERLACQVSVEEDMEVIVPYKESDTSKRKAKISQVSKKEKKIESRAKERYGAAFDIGTTTVVGSLVNLESEEVKLVLTRKNPQTIAGADVISRIQYIEEAEENLCFLQTLILNCCEDMIRQFNKKIEKVTVVANPTMSHIFLGYHPASLARFPFLQQFYGIQKRTGVSLKAAIFRQYSPKGESTRQSKKQGLMENQMKKESEHIENIEIEVLPNIGGQIGSDITMGLLATNILQKKGTYLFIDIGTNAEMALIKDGQCLVCSAAAGPVFEGASIVCGARAVDGAIESVEIKKDGILSIRTIENALPVGICGSGMIELVAKLLKIGLIRKDGYFLSREEAKAAKIAPALCERILEMGEESVFSLVGETIFVTQEDIRQIQLAKGAIAAGVKILLQEGEKTTEDIDEILVAGAFGSYLDKKSAREIGLFPNICIDKIKMAGNTASIGAVMALTSEKIKKEAMQLAKKAVFVELASHSKFYENFLTSLDFE